MPDGIWEVGGRPAPEPGCHAELRKFRSALLGSIHPAATPRRLVGHDMGEAQADACRRGWLERQVKADDAPAVDIDRDGEPRPTDRGTVHRVDQDEIDRCGVYLHEIKRTTDRWRGSVHRLCLRQLLAAWAMRRQR